MGLGKVTKSNAIHLEIRRDCLACLANAAHIAEELGLKLLCSTAYHPQTDGQGKRDRTPLLFCNSRRSLHMAKLTFKGATTNNNTISVVTGKTPNGIENRMDALLTLGYTLGYRLEGMKVATYYKDFLSVRSRVGSASCFSAVVIADLLE